MLFLVLKRLFIPDRLELRKWDLFYHPLGERHSSIIVLYAQILILFKISFRTTSNRLIDEAVIKAEIRRARPRLLSNSFQIFASEFARLPAINLAR